jgi:acyl-CoA thioester hydrolase
MHFSHKLRISYTHCTLGNHVYYSRYFDLLEIARGEFFRHIHHSLATLQEQDTVFQVSECWVKYLKAARYDDEIEIRLSISELKRVRFRFDCEIFRESDLLLKAWTQMVCVTREEKPRRIPDEVVNALERFCKPPENPQT